MGRCFVLLLLFVAACGGAQVPAHNGYKGKKPQPWKKAKTLKFNDKGEAKAEGELSYAEYKRAAWYVADLTTPGALDLRLEITPPGDAVNDDFDLGFEILDTGFRTIAKSDLEEGDAGELTKTKSLVDLEPGKYYVHLYLQHRLDSADYSLKATFKSMSTVGKSDFPAQVAFVPTLPMVPLQDDTPKSYKPTTTTTVVRKGPKPPPTTTPKKEDPKPTAEMTARILKMEVVSGGTQITIGRGTAGQAANGMKGQVVGVGSATFELTNCGERSCTATVKATPDQIKGSGSVVLKP